MAPRSRTGCLTCRQRKLKCTEEKPTCAQCAKANRQCILAQGVTFRHQQNPSMNASAQGQASLKSFYGYRETFAKSTKWVDVPPSLTFVYTNNPYEDDEEAEGERPNEGAVHGDDEFAARLAAVADDATRLNEDVRGHGREAARRPSYPTHATHGLEALSAAVASQDQYYAPPPAPMQQGEGMSKHYGPPMSPAGQQMHATPGALHNNLDFILNHNSEELTPGLTPTRDGNIDPQLHSADSISSPVVPDSQQQPSPIHVRTSSYASAFGNSRLHSKGVRPHCASIEDPELSFLMRDFAERAGLWMDLFDLGLFFGTNVPVLAVRCPLLLYSCVALSAKSLARVTGRKPIMGGQVTPSRQSRMELWSGVPRNAGVWTRRAREYYDLAVTLLRQALADSTKPPSSSLPEDASPQTVAAAQGVPLPTTDSDELVAATAILCIYEFLDASGSAWSSHLDGAKSLFDIAKESMVPLTLPPSPVTVTQQVTERLSSISGSAERPLRPPRSLSQGRRAVFWNFARQDMLSAFINGTSTRLDTADLPMWRSAGLKLTPEGLICPSHPQHPQYHPDNAMPEDLTSNALVWLLQKLVNFIAAGDDVPESVLPLGLGVRQQELLEYWQGMGEQLRIWYEGLPDSFHPTATWRAGTEDVEGGTGIQEKWFPRPMCASTMQSYHFARIQLLHNKPHVSTGTQASFGRSRSFTGSSLAKRHASYASILQQSRMHAKEIVAIGLGRTDEGARIHSVQPLWTAGFVLGVADEGQSVSAETESWRRSIISQLRGIERDMGWASEYRVQSLLELWGLPSDWGLHDVADETDDGRRQYDALGI